jgi:hypothetical protein
MNFAMKIYLWVSSYSTWETYSGKGAVQVHTARLGPPAAPEEQGHRDMALDSTSPSVTNASEEEYGQGLRKHEHEAQH